MGWTQNLIFASIINIALRRLDDRTLHRSYVDDEKSLLFYLFSALFVLYGLTIDGRRRHDGADL